MVCTDDLMSFVSSNFATCGDTGIGLDDNYFEKRYVNSLFAMRLVEYVENKYNIKVENSELSLDNFNTINRLASFLKRKLSRSGTDEA